MSELINLDRCAAYVAARATLAAVQRVAGPWPPELADRARRGAVDAIHLTAIAVSYAAGSPGRRHCLREAITSAVGVAAFVDAAGAMGYGAEPTEPLLEQARRVAGQTIALLGMLLHTSQPTSVDHD
jgi:hypothetical protein